MRLTVTQIMKQIATTVNQEATAPTEGGSEWNLWLEYLNRSYSEWAYAKDWEELKKRFYPAITGVSLASVALPGDFRKMATSPILWVDSEKGTQYPEIIEEEKDLYSINDKFFTLVGNPGDGFTMVLHPGTLASGASLEINYYSVPTSLASGHEIPKTADHQYLIDRTIAYILEARSDSRFQIEESKARQKLVAMIENSDAAKYDSYAGRNYVLDATRKQGWRIGRD